MLTLQEMSDLHFELYPDNGKLFVDSLDPSGVDVLALVGDILSTRFYTQTRDRLKQLADKYKRILLVPGNHEYWGMSREETLNVLSNAVAGLHNVTLLNNQVVTIEGRRFLGGTMWFPKWSPLHDFAASQLPDFKEIADFKDWVVDENKKFQLFAKKNLKKGDVVLTHYLPSMKSVAAKYKGSALNAFFVSEMDQLIQDRKPSLWIHGHTHFSFDYQISNTRVVCNPRGTAWYPNVDFKEKLLIPIP